MQLGFFQMIMTLLTLSQPPSVIRDRDSQIESALKYLESNISPFTNPCDDMRKYACGNFGINNLLDIFVGHKTHASSHGERYIEVDKILLTMLKETKPVVAAVQKAKTFFAKCANKAGIRDQGEETIIKELIRIGFEGKFIVSPYYLVYGDFHDTFDYMKMWANSLKYPTLFSNFLMFRVGVVRDLQKITPPYSYVPVIFTDPHDSTILLQSEEENAMDRILEYFNPTNFSATVRTEKDILMSRINSGKNAFWSRLKQIATERRLNDESAAFTAGKQYTRTNLAELQANTNKWMAEMRSDREYNTNFKIDWRKFFGYLFEDVPNGDRVRRSKIEKMLNDDSQFVIYVSDIKKFKSYVQLLAITDSNTFVLSIWLSTVINTIPMGPARLHRDYYRNAETVPKIVTLQHDEMCLAIIKDTFRPVVAHELLRTVKEDDKIAICEMADRTKITFHKIIENVSWLSQTAKIFMYPQIKSLHVHIPYADTTKNPDTLEDIYEEIDIEKMSFYESYMQILGSKRRNEFNRIFYPNSTKSRLENGPPVNLFPNDDVIKYYSRENEIEISIAAFGYPYYYGSHYLLQPLNLGALGFNLVRQMVHSFDEFIIKIIEGKSVATFAGADKPAMKDRIRTAIKKTIQRWALSYEGLSEFSNNWKHAQLEAIADNISLSVCYRTLLDYHSKSLESLTPESGIIERWTRNYKDETPAQYFTSALAMTMCRRPAITSTTNYVDYGERINELFKHWPHFKNIRKCFDNNDMMKLEENENRISILDNDN